MIHNKPVWAIICGAVRQEFELYTIIMWLCEQRSRGYLDGIVLSTWVGEVDNIPGLRKKLDFLEINLVEVQPLRKEINNFANMNYFRQIGQLNAGLNRIPNDVFVLKCRTDYCNEWVKKYEKVLSGEVNLNVQVFGKFHPGLHYKIAIMNYSISHPFILEDICFLGYKDDIRKMTVFESSPLYLGDRLSPDVLFFSSIFLHRFSIIKDFFEILHYWNFASALRDRLIQVRDEDFELPSILVKFYGLYFVILSNCFYACCTTASDNEYTIGLSTVFYGNSKGVERGWLIAVRDVNIFSQIMDFKVAQSSAANQLMEVIRSIFSTGKEVSICRYKDEYDELKKWGEKYLKIPVCEWLKNDWEKIFVPSALKLNFGQTGKILFSNYLINDSNQDLKFEDMMNNIVFSSIPYYKAVINELECIRKYNESLYEIALLATSRCKSDKVLKHIAIALLEGTISSSRIDAAEYVFKRYLEIEKEQFIKFPLVADQILAVYYYGKYCLRRYQRENVLEILYMKLKKIYEFNGVVHGSYCDKIIDFSEKIIETHISDGMTDESIESLIFFLAEVCVSNPFSANVLEYLKQNINEKYKEVVKKYENIGA